MRRPAARWLSAHSLLNGLHTCSALHLLCTCSAPAARAPFEHAGYPRARSPRSSTYQPPSSRRSLSSSGPTGWVSSSSRATRPAGSR